MKKAIVTGMVLVLLLFLLPSCTAGGVSQEEYDRVSSDLAAAQTQIQSLQGELSAKESEVEATKTELEAIKGEFEVIEEKLEQGKARVEILNAIFIPAITGELEKKTEMETMNLFLEWRDKIKDIGDPALNTKFEAILETPGDEAMNSFFIYLLESISKAL